MSQTAEPQTREPQARVRIPVRDQARLAGNQTGTTDLGDRLGDMRLGALSAAVAELVGGYGRRPTSATSWLLGEGCVVTALEDFMTPAEQALVQRGQARLVRQVRHGFGEAIADQYLRAAEGALARKVTAHRSEVICASGICLEIFSLENERRIACPSRSTAQLRGLQRTAR